MKKPVWIVSGLLVFISAFVIGDYFALFGTNVENRYDFVEINFNPVDQETGAPVLDVHVRCFQTNNNNACTEKKSNQPGIISVNIPVTRVITRTLLFQQSEKIQRTLDPKIHIMLIHRDYANPVETVMIDELDELEGKTIKVHLPKHVLYD